MRFPFGRFCLYLVAPILVGTVWAQKPVEEEVSPFNVGFEMGTVSTYLWHGLEQSQGAPVLQSWLWVSAYGVKSSGWANMASKLDPSLPEHRVVPDRLDDIELILEYEKEIGEVTISPSFQYYFVPTKESTGEVILKLSYSLLSLDLFTTQTFDIIRYPGSYFGELGCSFTRKIGSIELNATALVGWGSDLFNEINLGPSKWALNQFNLEAGLTWYPLEFLYVYPVAGVSVALDKDISEQLKLDGFRATVPYVGVYLGIER